MNSEFKGNGLYILYMPQRDTNMSDVKKKGAEFSAVVLFLNTARFTASHSRRCEEGFVMLRGLIKDLF